MAGDFITISGVKHAHKSPVTNALAPYRQVHLLAIDCPAGK